MMQQIIRKAGPNKKLLLHVCCAPCATTALERLSEDFELVIDFYNPNIYSRDEYEKRGNELKKLVEQLGLKAQVIIEDYDHSEFLDYVSGFEGEPEGGLRCALCYNQRLKRAKERAEELGCDYYATTLTLSPLKNSQMINILGRDGKALYLPTDFKKRDGFLRSTELSKKYNLYRQDYCGCEFSRR